MNTKVKLGKLEVVNVRDIWKHEQYDFSNWLAQDENIKALGEILNTSLTDIETEKDVGNFRCDIFCKDESGKSVLIENQLEPTNHDHLGKLITYASGLNASVIVWIVTEARQEHASAVEWLNNNTTEDVSFFLLEVHAYRIGNSYPAPMFKIIEQPNNFVKTTKALAKAGELNNSQKCRYEFWCRFNEAVSQKGKPFNLRKANTDHWYDIAIGSSQCHISIDLINKEHVIRVSLYIKDNKELFEDLLKNKTNIETAFGESLNWEKLENKKASRISMNIPELDFDNQENYSDLINQTIDKVVALSKAMKPYI